MGTVSAFSLVDSEGVAAAVENERFGEKPEALGAEFAAGRAVVGLLAEGSKYWKRVALNARTVFWAISLLVRP